MCCVVLRPLWLGPRPRLLLSSAAVCARALLLSNSTLGVAMARRGVEWTLACCGLVMGFVGVTLPVVGLRCDILADVECLSGRTMS